LSDREDIWAHDHWMTCRVSWHMASEA